MEPSLHESIGQAKRLVGAIGADLGVVFDRAAERLYLIDETAHEVPVDLALLLFVQLIASNGRQGKLALPITITSCADDIVDGSGLEIVRTRASLADLTQAAAAGGVIFGGALSGGYVFPEFLPAYDAMASLCNLLELLAPVERPLSELVATLPKPTLVHRQLPCPWAKKGLVMRLLNERFADREVDLLDGIKVFEERGWVQVLPDPDEPLIHIYAEGRDDEATEELEREARDLVAEITGREESLARG
jgi:mannose-1-phosphate guanylyltransferase/phosphomannomutase